MANVTLSGGPADGTVINAGDPWPRDYLRVFADGEFNTYIIDDPDTPPYTATWSDPDEPLPGEDVSEGAGIQGPPGLDGPPGPPGPVGPPGTPITHRGEWDVDTVYALNDAVYYEGSSYASLTDLNEGNQPDLPESSVNWALMAAQGEPGNEGPPGPAGAAGPEGPQGDPGSPLPNRETINFSTASLATSVSENGVVAICEGFRILHLETSRPAWVRFYTTPAKRTADASREIDVDPTGDHGLTFEGITSDDLLSFDTSPVPQSFSMEVPPSEDIAYRVTNLGTVGAVDVTLIIQRQED